MNKKDISYRNVVDEYGEYCLPDFGQFDEADGVIADNNFIASIEPECEDVACNREQGKTDSEEVVITVGKYGIMREQYLKKNRKVLYAELLTHGDLLNHLIAIECEAQEFFDYVVSVMAARHGVSEELKSSDPMKWVGMMNNIRAAVDEMIRAEIIYV